MSFLLLVVKMGVLLASLLSFQIAQAVTSVEVFARYPNKYFIESGSYTGNGIQMALQAGFQQIYSIEIAPHHYQQCHERFIQCKNVFLFKGDSALVLPKILEQIDEPATFWLDGHYSSGTTARGDTNSPILKELEGIRRHHVKTHTILVDDIRQCGTIHFDFVELDDIIQKILQINPNYEISFEDGFIPNDVLVAKVPPKI